MICRFDLDNWVAIVLFSEPRNQEEEQQVWKARCELEEGRVGWTVHGWTRGWEWPEAIKMKVWGSAGSLNWTDLGIMSKYTLTKAQKKTSLLCMGVWRGKSQEPWPEFCGHQWPSDISHRRLRSHKTRGDRVFYREGEKWYYLKSSKTLGCSGPCSSPSRTISLNKFVSEQPCSKYGPGKQCVKNYLVFSAFQIF